MVAASSSVVLLATCLGCGVALYPVARAFGSPSEEELASCRTRLREMQGSLPTAKLTVHPPYMIRGSRGQWEPTATGSVVEALRSRGFEDVGGTEALPAAPFQAPGHNQLRYTWQRAHAYAAWARGAQLGPGWHLFADFIVLGDQLAGIGIYVTDAEGNLALVRILNSHHDEWKVVAQGLTESGCAMLVDVLLRSLKIPAERLYPPYGVG